MKPTFEKWGVRLAGTVVGLSLEKDKGGREWLKNASTEDLAAIRFLALPTDVDAECLPPLKKLAAASPEIVLAPESTPALRQALQFFQPRSLMIPDKGDADADGRTLLSEQTRLETLVFAGDTPGSLDFLRSLPNLRRLVIAKWDVEKAGPLPPGLTHLRSLHVFASNLKDISSFGALPAGLEELSLTMGDDLVDVSGLAKLYGLKTLILNGSEKVRDLPTLAGLHELQWVGLPPAISQEQFAAFISAHRNLKIVELVGCKNVTNLAPLRELSGLEGLIISGKDKDGSLAAVSPQNLAVVCSLKSLRYVGITPEHFTKSPNEVAALQKALPDALVVTAAPFCLGSGWILLLLPAIAAALLLGSRARRSATTSPLLP